MNKDIFMDAVGYLDVDILAQHLQQKDRLRHRPKRKTHVWKWSAIAASICVVIALGALMIPYIQDIIGSETLRYYYVGATVQNSAGSLTFHSVDTENHTCSFTLVKEKDSQIYFKFGGFIVTEEWTDEQGVGRQKVQLYDVVTPFENYKPDNGYEVLDAELVITVNGNIVEKIPNEAGEYEITIDYGALYATLDHVDDVVEVYDFGMFKLLEVTDVE